ncbi:MAG: PadR family transcriptional regulator [Chloroflexota bacterium]
MRHSRHRRHFWKDWEETETQATDEKQDKDYEPTRAWRRHFASFFGTLPEKHWLFSGRRFKPWASGGWGPPGLFNPFIADLMSKGSGLLPLLVMHLLSEKPRYGNDIMHEIEQRTQGRWGSNPGAIYPLLSLMEEGGLVEGEWEDADKRTRRIYRLTPQGRQELDRLKEIMRPKLEETLNILRSLLGEISSEEE